MSYYNGIISAPLSTSFRDIPGMLEQNMPPHEFRKQATRAGLMYNSGLNRCPDFTLC
jgi:hypothetical protein